MRKQKDKQGGRRPPARQDRQRPMRSPDHAPARAFSRTAEGVVSANRAGFGFVRVEGQEEACSCRRRRWPASCTATVCACRVERGRDGRYFGPAGKNPRARHQGLRRHARSPRAHRLRDRGGPAHRHALPGAAGRTRRRAPWRLGHRRGDALRRVGFRRRRRASRKRLDPEKAGRARLRSGHRALRSAA